MLVKSFYEMPNFIREGKRSKRKMFYQNVNLIPPSILCLIELSAIMCLTPKKRVLISHDYYTSNFSRVFLFRRLVCTFKIKYFFAAFISIYNVALTKTQLGDKNIFLFFCCIIITRKVFMLPFT